MSNDNLGDRMKGYENIERRYLTKRMPTIIRVDGKAFHTFTRGFQKPFDMVLMQTMWDTAKYLCENVMGCKIAYVQSDEITLLLTDYDNLNTQAWFDKNIQKMCSISASMTTLAFNKAFETNTEKIIYDLGKYTGEGDVVGTQNRMMLDYEKALLYRKKYMQALFDSRIFNIPKEEVCNVFIWRQQDATRNAIEMVGRYHFGHSRMFKVNGNQVQEMLFQEKGINFNDLPTYQKRGACIVKETYDKDGTPRTRWVVDKDIPIFTQDRDYIEKYL